MNETQKMIEEIEDRIQHIYSLLLHANGKEFDKLVNERNNLSNRLEMLKSPVSKCKEPKSAIRSMYQYPIAK